MNQYKSIKDTRYQLVYYSTIFIVIWFSGLYALYPANTFAAETHVTEDMLEYGATWTASSSPYILENNIYIPSGSMLVINPGVTVLSGSSTDTKAKAISLNGDLLIQGTKQSPVIMKGISGIYASDDIVDIHYAQIEGVATVSSSTSTTSEGISLKNATGILDHVSVSGMGKGVTAKGSTVTLTNSRIEGNTTGIWSYYKPKIFLVENSGQDNGGRDAIGGIGNALALTSVTDQRQNQITVSSSSIMNNISYDIYNETVNEVDARENWWGNPDGPNIAMAHGPVVTSPWLREKPDEDLAPVCCSNVLFIPGIESSSLSMMASGMFGIGSSTNDLWVPNRNDDVRKLYLDAQGNSISSGIFTNGVIGSAFGYGVYGKFIAMMNSMVADGVMNAWVPFAYDWRMGIDRLADTALIDTLTSLATSSKNGKVTIIAHSNGGLLTKMLGKKLQDLGRADVLGLIDRVIFVAVPHLGTPQAIAGMLHGDNQSIAGGLFLKKGVARTFGLHMLGAYGLLPSRTYFERMSGVSGAVVAIGTSTIGNFDSLKSFLTGLSDGRTQPEESKTSLPAVLSDALLGVADHIHSLIDSWKFPTTTSVFSITGLGNVTTQFVEYLGKKVNKIAPKIGDGTVLGHAADAYGVSSTSQSIYFDEQTSNSDHKEKIEHANILEADATRSLIKNIVSTTTGTSESVQGIPLPKYMSTDYDAIIAHLNKTSDLKISIHSPVDLDVYDDHGGHIGHAPNPFPGSDLDYVENTITNGSYDISAEDDGSEKYIYVPAEGKYTVKLKGTGVGTFTYQIEQFVGDTSVASTTFTDLPVTPLLLASSSVRALTPWQGEEGMMGVSDATSTTPSLDLDIDGNGTIDITATSSDTLDPIVHLNAMRVLIQSFNLRANAEKKLLQRIDKIIKLLGKEARREDREGLRDRIQKVVTSTEQKILNKHWAKRSLTDANRAEIVNMFEALLTAFE